MKLAEILERFEKDRISRVKVGAFDIDGLLRGKHIHVDKFRSAAEGAGEGALNKGGLGFCDVVFGWDIGDQLYDNVGVTGWHTGYPDAVARIDLETYRPVPWENETALFLLDLFGKDGRPLEMSPRGVLARVVERAASMGYTPFFGAEYEFWFFRENAHSLREKGFRNLTPLTPGMFGYSVTRASANAELVLNLFDELAEFRVPLEGLHTETGPGVYEAAIQVAPAMEAADRAALFKTAVKEIAGRFELTPTFMAKWSADLPGSSGHLHQSLWDRAAKKNLFSAKSGLPKLMRHYVAGQVSLLAEWMPLYCPTINSYKRTVPGAWAPVNATWGVDNRTAAVRAIPSAGKSARVEMRASGADINPYLAMAASLAAGLEGIERKLEPPPAVTNAYESGAPPLPRHLAEATRRFRVSEAARRWFGEEFVEHFAATREWEVRQYEKAVTDWELARYLESV
jgi:glutamine synthetase